MGRFSMDIHFIQSNSFSLCHIFATIYNISGTDPQYGIDVEPEFDYPVTGLKIHGNTIYGCSGGAITACKGSDYEIYNNTVTGNNIIAVWSSNVQIYGNTLNDTFIRVMEMTVNVTAFVRSTIRSLKKPRRSKAVPLHSPKKLTPIWRIDRTASSQETR